MIGIIITTSIALILGLIIVFIDSITDSKNKESEYLELLPGYNCGACGFGSCSGMAHKMCENINNYKRCKPLNGEKLIKMEEYIEKNSKYQDY